MNDLVRTILSMFRFKRFITRFLLFVVVGVLFGIAFYYFAYNDVTDTRISKILTLLIILAVTIIVPAIISYLANFLKNDTARDVSSLLENLKKNKAENEISNRVLEYINSNLSVQEVENNVFEKTLASLETYLTEKFDNKYSDVAQKDILKNRIHSDLVPLEKNVETYIDRLQRNSIVNLLIGIIGTMIATIILSITILSKYDYKTIFDFSIHFLPRLTFVIFIQVFAFFFLRLYKNNLEDAKYFQNELTNINCKIAAIKIAQMLGRTDKLDDLLKDLSAVERNFKLFKDESLIGIERAKIEKDVDLDMLSTFKDFLKAYRKEE